MYARGGSTLTDFPVLISIINDMSLSNIAKSSGDDICFYASNSGVLLKHELEYYTNGTLIAWVKIPSLTTVSGENEIYMYYGHAASASMHDPTNVWDVNYVGVWHKNDSNTTTIHDSTQNANHGTKTGANEPSEIIGKIGKCQEYDGINDIIDVGHPFSGALLTEVTVSAWIKLNDLLVSHGIISKSTGGTSSTVLLDIMRYNTDADKYSFFVGDGAAYGSRKSTAVDLTNWNYIVGVQNSSTIYTYANGELISTASARQMTNNTSQTMRFGIAFNSGSFRLKGAADEIRCSTNARSAGWILTEYTNQGFPTEFYTVGSAFDGLDILFSVYPDVKPIGIPLVYSNQSTSIYNITNATFQFGDGTTVTNVGTNALNPIQKTYTVPGTYTNWLTIVTTKPQIESNNNILTIGEYILPKLDLYWVPAKPVVGQYVRFIANSSATYGAITNWRIDFGTGSKYIWRQYMTNHPVAYRYPYSGEFAVHFSVVDQYGYSNGLTLTNNVTDFGAQDVTKMPQRVFKYGRDFPLYFKYRLTGYARKVQLRVIHMNGMILRNLGFKEGFEGEDIIFTWDGKTQWNTYLTHPPCFLRYDVYSEDGFIETVIEIIVVY